MKPLLFAIVFTARIEAQRACYGAAALGDGIRLEYALYSDGERIDPGVFCSTEEGKGFLRRILRLAPDRAFGYEVHVKRNGPGAKPFHVSVQPAKQVGAGYFPRSPEPVDVGPSDTVEFVLLENPAGRLRLIERFRVWDASDTAAGARHLLFSYQTPGPFPPAGAAIRLDSPKLARNGEIVGQTRSEVRGSLLWVWVPGKGRFLFSIAERGRFRKAATVRGEKLEFQWDGIVYSLTCGKSVIDLPGEWALWVRFDEGWKPDPGGVLGSVADVLQVGAIGD